MALSDKKYERMFSTTGSDADKIDTDTFNEIKEDFDQNRYILDVAQLKILGPVIYQIQLLTEELDALRAEISANKDKTSMVLGTTNKTALAGNTTTISTAQANAIIANTAKTSMTLGTSSNTALAGDTNIVTIGSNTTIAFGDMVSTTKKGVTTYSIVMTVTNGGVSKTITHTLT